MHGCTFIHVSLISSGPWPLAYLDNFQWGGLYKREFNGENAIFSNECDIHFWWLLVPKFHCFLSKIFPITEKCISCAILTVRLLPFYQTEHLSGMPPGVYICRADHVIEWCRENCLNFIFIFYRPECINATN